MKKMKNKWLSRALACALAVTLVSGTAVMTPVADIVGTNITANAENDYSGYNEWTGTGTDENGNEAQVTCYWKIDNGTLYIAGTVPDTNGRAFMPPWYDYGNNITEVYAEKGAKTSADASYLFSNLGNVTYMDLSCLDTRATGNMSSMFMYQSAYSKKSVPLGSGTPE